MGNATLTAPYGTGIVFTSDAICYI